MLICLFVALRPKSTAMVIAGRKENTMLRVDISFTWRVFGQMQKF